MSRTSGHSSPLMVQQDELTIGETWASNRITHSFPVHNVSHQQVSIIGFQTSCYCASVSPHALDIPAGSSRVITVDIAMPKGGAIDEETDISVHVVPVIHGRTSGIAPWEITAHVLPLLSLSKSYIEFVVGRPEDACTGTNATQSLQVTIVRPLQSLRVEHCAAPVAIDVHKKSDVLYELSVEMLGPLPENGGFTISPAFHSVVRSGETVLSTPLVIRGRPYRPIIADPESLQLGYVDVGLPQRRTIKLTSQAGEKFLIRSATCSCEAVVLRTDHGDSDPGEIQRIDVHGFHLLGPQESRIRLVLQLVDHDPPIELFVPVAYYGVQRDGLTGE